MVRRANWSDAHSASSILQDVFGALFNKSWLASADDVEQGRLARLDKALLVGIPGLLFLALLYASLHRAWALQSSYDLAYFRQAAWLIAEGDSPFSTIRGLYLFADHANYIMFPIGWLSAIFPTQALLLTLQAGALAAGAVPLYLIARRIAYLPTWLCGALVGAYSLFPALHNVNMYDFHPEVFAIPAFIGAAYFALRDAWWAYGLCIALALSTREDMAVPAAVLGGVLFLQHKHKAGVITAVAALALLALNLGVIMPSFANGHFQQADRLGRWGDSLPSAVINIVTQPRTALHEFTQFRNLTTLVALFAPLLFLSILRPLWLLPGIPLQFLYLFSTVDTAHTIEGQYTIAIIPFLFIAAALALKDRQFPPRETATILLVGAFMFCYTYAVDARLYLRDTTPLRHDARYAAVVAASDLVGKDDSVIATVRVWQRLAEREDLYNFPMLFDGSYQPPEDPEPLGERKADVDWIIVDTADPGQWNEAWWDPLAQITKQEGFHKVFDQDGVVAFKR